MNRPVQAYDQAGQAFPVEGVVVLDGPDGVAITLSPEAAEQTGKSLISAAAIARQQDASGQPTD